jgi:hypothetical protein
MSADAGTDTPAEDNTADAEGPPTDRDDALGDLREVRDHARYKVFGKGRIRDAEKEDIRIKYLRLIVQSANAERRLLADKELEDMADELDELRAEVRPGAGGELP